MSHIDSHIDLLIIKAADARRGPLAVGIGYRARLWQGITLYKVFREQQSGATAQDSVTSLSAPVPSRGTETSSRR